MKTFFQKNHRLVFYGMWLLLGLMQAGLTELQDDEAYYWVYGRFLDWGYFDHPPMIAVLVKMGYAIFPNELGVRLFPLLLNILSLVIIEKLLGKKNPLLFYAIALSIAVLQISGFEAVPDIPLIFFTALFFYCYKRFIGNFSWQNTLLLGLSVAFLFYSKYHAVLIVLFTLLSNVKLLRKYQTYIAGLIALLLFAPHLWWQYQHNWVSFRYHLFESNVNPYKFSFTLEYIGGQLLLPGPLAGFILLPAAFLYKPKNETERALRFNMIGIYIFFLLSSFRGKVEGNWTSPAIVSLIILSFGFLSEKNKWQRVLLKTLPVTLLIVLFARIAMIEDIVPIKTIRNRYHSWKEWPVVMKEKTKGLPIVFNNSYQRASKYWFYSGQMTYSLNLYKQRRNNYNFWPIEDSLLGKPVYILDKYELWKFPDSLNTPIGWIGYRYDPSFVSFAKVKIGVIPMKLVAKEGETIRLSCSYTIPPQYKEFIKANNITSDTTRVAVFNNDGWIKDIVIPVHLADMLDRKDTIITVAPDLPKGKYFLRMAISAGALYPTHNSEKISLTIN